MRSGIYLTCGSQIRRQNWREPSGEQDAGGRGFGGLGLPTEMFILAGNFLILARQLGSADAFARPRP